MKDLEEMFRNLRSDMRTEFDKNKKVTKEKVLDTITDLPNEFKDEYMMYLNENEARLEKAESIRQILRILNIGIKFTDYELIGHLIKELGSKGLNKKLVTYEEKFKSFLRKATVKHIMQSDQWVGKRKAIDDLPEGFIELRAKINEKSSLYNLERLNRSRKKLCGQLRLCEALVYLKGAQECQSFFVTFIFPAVLYKYVVQALNDLDICFALREQIVSIVIDDKAFVPQEDGASMASL